MSLQSASTLTPPSLLSIGSVDRSESTSSSASRRALSTISTATSGSALTPEDKVDGTLSEQAGPATSEVLSSRDLLLRIFCHVVDDEDHNERRRLLSSFALVAKACVEPAQRLLFSELVFFNEDTIALWLSSDAIDRYESKSVHIDGRFDNVSNVLTDAVLRRVHGIERLRVDFVNNLSTSVFTYEHLRTLNTLTLHTKLWCDAVPVLLPFSLQHLVLGGSYHPLAFVHAIFSKSITTLDSLTTTMQALQSPSERALLNGSIARLGALRTFIDFQRSAEEFIGLLMTLPSTIEDVSTSFVDRNRLRLITSALALPNLARVRSLRFMYMPHIELVTTEAGRELIALCRERRILILHGHTPDHLRQEHYLSSDDRLKPFV